MAVLLAGRERGKHHDVAARHPAELGKGHFVKTHDVVLGRKLHLPQRLRQRILRRPGALVKSKSADGEGGAT